MPKIIVSRFIRMSAKIVLKIFEYIILINLSILITYKLTTDYYLFQTNSSLEEFASNIEDYYVDLHEHTNESFQCIRTKTLLNQYNTTICVYNTSDDDDDTDISSSIIRDGIWEEELVIRFLRIFSRYPQLAFFDIGADLGVYTMYAAASDCSNIIAIEYFQPNIERIRRAIQIEHVQSRVVLIQRIIYDQSNIYLSLRINIMNTLDSQRINSDVSLNVHDPFMVKTIRFDDLLSLVQQRHIQEAIIKIDIEGFEDYFCQSSETIFNEINIQMILMKWTIIQQTSEKAKFVRDFLLDHKYVPLNPLTCEKQSEINYLHWNLYDIFWVKQNYTYLCEPDQRIL